MTRFFFHLTQERNLLKFNQNNKSAYMTRTNFTMMLIFPDSLFCIIQQKMGFDQFVFLISNEKNFQLNKTFCSLMWSKNV